MKALSFTLLILGTVILLSSALPVEKDKDGSLLEHENGQGEKKFLQKRRPPAKIPGPKFGGDEDEGSETEEGDEKAKPKKGKKAGLRSARDMRSYDLEALDNHGQDNSKSKGKDKGRHLHTSTRDTDYAYLNEETQQEFSNLLHSQ